MARLCQLLNFPGHGRNRAERRKWAGPPEGRPPTVATGKPAPPPRPLRLSSPSSPPRPQPRPPGKPGPPAGSCHPFWVQKHVLLFPSADANHPHSPSPRGWWFPVCSPRFKGAQDAPRLMSQPPKVGLKPQCENPVPGKAGFLWRLGSGGRRQSSLFTS